MAVITTQTPPPPEQPTTAKIILTGSILNDQITVDSTVDSVRGGKGTDTAFFSGDFADYTYTTSQSFVTTVTHTATNKAVSLHDVEEVSFNNVLYDLSNNDLGEFRVNTHIGNSQLNSSVTYLNDGGFLVTWESYSHPLDSSQLGIFAQRYDINGNQSGVEFKVNTYTSHAQTNSHTTVLENGDIVITWQSQFQDGDGYGVYAKRYNDQAQSVYGSEFRVNTTTNSNQAEPKVTSLSNGDFLISWEGTDSYGAGIFAQRYSSTGEKIGIEFQLNTVTDINQKIQDIDALGDGGFVVTFQTDHLSQNNINDQNIYAKIFTNDITGSTGGIAGDEFFVNTTVTGNQTKPAVTTLKNGNFVITWESNDKDEGNVYAQIYSSIGIKIGTEFQVSTYTINRQETPAISDLKDGGFVISWASYHQDGDQNGVYVQRFDENGNKVGSETQASTYTTSNQSQTDISSTQDGGFIITWTSYYQDQDQTEVYAQRFNSEGEKLGISNIVTLTKIYGTNVSEVITGTTGVDHIVSLEGADYLDLKAGDDKITMQADGIWETGYQAKNVDFHIYVGTHQVVNLEGYNKFNDVINAGEGFDSVELTDGNDALFYDNIYSDQNASISANGRLKGLEKIETGNGNDLVDLTSSDNSYGVNTINSGSGDDIIWGSFFDLTINAGSGNDIIYTGGMLDKITTGTGADEIQITASSRANIVTDFDINEDSISILYRPGIDDATFDSLSIDQGVITWDVGDQGLTYITSWGQESFAAPTIDLSSRIDTSDFSTIPELSITFVEII